MARIINDIYIYIYTYIYEHDNYKQPYPKRPTARASLFSPFSVTNAITRENCRSFRLLRPMLHAVIARCINLTALPLLQLNRHQACKHKVKN